MVKALEKTNAQGSGFSAFCKKVPKGESQTSSGEVADLSDYAGKTIREGWISLATGPPLHTGQAWWAAFGLMICFSRVISFFSFSFVSWVIVCSALYSMQILQVKYK